MDKVSIAEGERGRWAVSRFTVIKQDAEFAALRAMMKGRRYLPPGIYTKITRNGLIIMSDTPDEMRDRYEPVRRAHGHVLINGLGLGMVLANILKNTEVTAITVVEIDQDVIDLVGPNYVTDPRVEIVCCSAFDYKPPKGIHYGAVWHDIWDDICTDNLPQMTKLKRKYGRLTDWQGCWCEYQCRRGRS